MGLGMPGRRGQALLVAEALGVGQQRDDSEDAGEDAEGQCDHAASIRASPEKRNLPLRFSGEIVGIAIKCCRAGANATASITAFAQANRQVRDSAIVRI